MSASNLPDSARSGVGDPAQDPAPTVSVLMSVYNGVAYLDAAIESILAQTYTDFELLLVDDGSTDDTYARLLPYAQRDRRVRLSRTANQGMSRARNQLLQQARGELIAIMDADDVALPERLALQVAFLRQHPEVVCVGGNHQVIDQRGRLLTTLTLPQTDAEIQRLALAGHGSICHPCATIRRWAMVQAGGYDGELRSAQDLDLWLKLGELGALANLPDTILQYRLHLGSLSAQHSAAQRQEARQACERAWQRRGITGTFEATEPWRPGASAASRYPFLLRYGWWAFNSGEYGTALVYGAKAVAAQPWRQGGWRLLTMALLKRPAQVGAPS